MRTGTKTALDPETRPKRWESTNNGKCVFDTLLRGCVAYGSTIYQNRYEMETSKLRAEYEKKFSRYAGYADRLEKKAGVMLQHAKESDGVF